jgi:hypothetical protein
MTSDIKWTGRDIEIADDGDAATVSGRQLLEQSVAVIASDELRDEIGNVASDEMLRRVETSLTSIADRDVDVGSIQRINVLELDRSTNTLTVEAVYSQAENSTITIPLN